MLSAEIGVLVSRYDDTDPPFYDADLDAEEPEIVF
jgi:hypothetical protein